MTDTDVLVIGAGAAGLAAADRLLSGGKRVIVLEARTRIGGRAFTDEATLGLPFDRGAQWLHNADENPFRTDAARLGRETWPSPLQDALVLTNGIRVPDGPDRLARAEAALSRRVWARGLIGGDFAIGTLAQDDLERTAAQLAAFAMATDADRLSAMDFGALAGGPDHSVAGGLGRLIADLWAEVPVRVGHRVESIDWRRADRVAVSGSFGTVTAARLVVTVPAPVLAAGGIRFDPVLPADRQEAIAALQGGRFVKVGLRLDAPLRDVPEYAYDTAALIAGQSAGLHISRRDPLVTAIFAGSHAETVSRGGAPALEAAARDTVARLLGSEVAGQIRAAASTDWSADPLSLGPYTTVAPGHAAARETYGAAIDDRLFFAGDSVASPYAVTVMGARLSGEAAANRIMAL
jgi:monoamine oxidase